MSGVQLYQGMYRNPRPRLRKACLQLGKQVLNQQIFACRFGQRCEVFIVEHLSQMFAF